MFQKKIYHILVAPLDWGLGHATRCIPIIKCLQAAGCKVFIAGEGNVKALLQQEFNTIQFLPLKGYRIQYSKNKRFFVVKILAQLPKIFSAIGYEHKWLKKTVKKWHIDIVISDNRYGLYHSAIPCIFITHQLCIQAPFKKAEQWMQIINYHFINRFKQCWIPDYEGSCNIAGSLSHPKKLPATQVKYIGPLCRFHKEENDKKYRWLILLSGPEPQRSLLENKIVSCLSEIKGPILIVRGKPQESENTCFALNRSDCKVVNHLTTTEMQQAFSQAEWVLSRAGYTTVMEILCLQKKSVLIPTPQQTEQEYLATHLLKQHWCYTFSQDEKNFIEHLNAAENFLYKLPNLSTTLLQNVINHLLMQYERAV